MTVIRDRRKEPPNDKYGTDKERFRLRYRAQIKKAVQDHVADSSIKDLGTKGISVPIPKEMTHEPILHHSGETESFRKVFPGNVSLDVGDQIPKPQGGSGQGQGGKEASADAEDGEDDFVWVSEDEVLDLLFEGRSLPDMTKLAADHVKIMQSEPSGHVNKGPSHRMDMARTDAKRKAESLVLTKVSEHRILANLSEQFNILAPNVDPDLATINSKIRAKMERSHEIAKAMAPFGSGLDADTQHEAQDLCDALKHSLDVLKGRSPKISEAEQGRLHLLERHLVEQFKLSNKSRSFKEQHLTYEYDDDVPVPSAKAVMFCLMDVSGSMGQEEKNTAKSFFWLLNKFLNTAYDEVDIVYIAHTTTAKEVDEEEFFYGKETGGTIVSTCIDKTMEIMKERYPSSEWNIYSAQASDGDNISSDNPKLIDKLEDLLPHIQSHYYVEVRDSEYYRGPSDILDLYEDLQAKYTGKMKVQEGLASPKDSLDTFKKFFPVNGEVSPSSHLNAYL